MSSMTAGRRLIIAQPEMHDVAEKRIPFHSGPMASSSA
jgi:hypothetical protein